MDNGKVSEAGLDRSFETIITKDDGFPEKPNPESFISIIGKSDTSQELFYCIGDRDLDIEAGKNAGIKAIFFNTDGGMREKADFNISDHKQLGKILAISNG
ncbi:HAD-IA family hydrolase [Leptolyngbya sp. NK1-12]|uniref:HAD-IA family hydrolase n=1 Tax=Leptolyngbya sp. NK1-12 TaxID=2547451 RepID=A0AA97AKN3_9CYAN|nr:HAD-IA family hydrolase [Leptolyngbya sp. NK1-12]